MITYVQGDLFTSPAKVLVNTVNTVGVMGKGIAYRFKHIYPTMFKTYRHYCETKQLAIGKLHLHKTHYKWVLNFPTKAHWRYPSHPSYIDQGLRTFSETYSNMGIISVAFPALGCGNGELDYNRDVRPLMEHYLSSLSIPVFIYFPQLDAKPPEHRDVARIATWLRSMPAALPFDEVWRDISAIVAANDQFATLSKGVTYKAEVLSSTLQEPPKLRVTVGTRRYHYDSELLLDFWQQLRDYGFVHRSIAPGYHRVSYLIPIFGRLPYVRIVTLSESWRGLKTRPAIGLHVVPPALPDHGFFSRDQYELAET